VTLVVCLAGEGRHELGGHASDHAEDREPDPGILHALLRRTWTRPFVVKKAVPWRRIRKYRAGGHRSAEARNVLGLALLASESQCQVAAFVRDRDRNEGREREIEQAILQARELFLGVRVVGAAAVETSDAWILALLGDGRAKSHHRPKERLGERGVVSTEARVHVIDDADLAVARTRAHSLDRWLARAEEAVPPAGTSP
jgi:hypothetical protein